MIPTFRRIVDLASVHQQDCTIDSIHSESLCQLVSVVTQLNAEIASLNIKHASALSQLSTLQSRLSVSDLYISPTTVTDLQSGCSPVKNESTGRRNDSYKIPEVKNQKQKRVGLSDH